MAEDSVTENPCGCYARSRVQKPASVVCATPRHATPYHAFDLRFPLPSHGRLGGTAILRARSLRTGVAVIYDSLARTSPSRFNGRFSREARYRDLWGSASSPSTIVSDRRVIWRRRETRPEPGNIARAKGIGQPPQREREIVGGVCACVKLTRKARDCFENDAFLERHGKRSRRSSFPGGRRPHSSVEEVIRLRLRAAVGPSRCK